MPFITIRNTQFKYSWSELINLGETLSNQTILHDGRLISTMEEETIEMDGGPLDFVD